MPDDFRDDEEESVDTTSLPELPPQLKERRLPPLFDVQPSVSTFGPGAEEEFDDPPYTYSGEAGQEGSPLSSRSRPYGGMRAEDPESGLEPTWLDANWPFIFVGGVFVAAVIFVLILFF